MGWESNFCTGGLLAAHRPASSTARHRPIPRPPPVTSTRFPLRSTPASTSSVVEVAPNVAAMVLSLSVDTPRPSPATPLFAGLRVDKRRLPPFKYGATLRLARGASPVDDEEPRVTARRPRADAQRNRLRLLDTAKTTFAEKGAAAGLEEIARAAVRGGGKVFREPAAAGPRVFPVPLTVCRLVSLSVHAWSRVCA